MAIFPYEKEEQEDLLADEVEKDVQKEEIASQEHLKSSEESTKE